MKTLNNLTTEDNMGFHFESPADGLSVSKWVRDNLDKFNLNEKHSCKVTHFKGDITISGDEDLVLLQVANLEVIKLDSPHNIIQKIITRKRNDIDCTEAESAELKAFLRENRAYIDANENEILSLKGFMVKDIVKLFPCETSEV